MMEDLPNAQTQIDIDSPEAAQTQAGGGPYQTVNGWGRTPLTTTAHFSVEPSPHGSFLSAQDLLRDRRAAFTQSRTLSCGSLRNLRSRYIFARVTARNGYSNSIPRPNTPQARQ